MSPSRKICPHVHMTAIPFRSLGTSKRGPEREIVENERLPAYLPTVNKDSDVDHSRRCKGGIKVSLSKFKLCLCLVRVLEVGR